MTFAPLILLLGTLVGSLLAPDYFDCGRLGLIMIVGAGWGSLVVVARYLKAPRPLSTAAWAVAPWTLGLAGVAYIGFFFLPFEVLATIVLLRQLAPQPGRAKLLFLSTAARAASFVPLVVLKLAGSLFSAPR